MNVFMAESSLYLMLQVINAAARILPGNPEAVFETTRKPALGPSFTFLTDATLWLSQRPPTGCTDKEATLHVAEVFRSRTTVHAIYLTRENDRTLTLLGSAPRRGHRSK